MNSATDFNVKQAYVIQIMKTYYGRDYSKIAIDSYERNLFNLLLETISDLITVITPDGLKVVVMTHHLGNHYLCDPIDLPEK